MKRIVICCDGTWNDPETKDITNVLKTARCIKPTAPGKTQQVVFYDWGVGTGGRFDKISGGAFGKGLDKNIQDAYRFLVHNYASGDEIFFFGFSRGAYTARSTAGFIRNCGVLKKQYADRIPEAYDLYRGRSKPGSKRSTNFRNQYSRETRIKFMGVWDTVGALGVPLKMFRRFNARRYSFHDTTLSRSVDRAFHAVAIDEKRKPFAPTLWKIQPSPTQVVEQVWFAGVHSDIGGGYPNEDLANIAFRWLIQKAVDNGLVVDAAYVGQFKGSFDGHLHNSMSTLYRTFGKHVRPIGIAQKANETVHPSAIQRAQSMGYGPENLAEFLAGQE